MADQDRPMTDARAMPWSEARRILTAEMNSHQQFAERAAEPQSLELKISEGLADAIHAALALGDRCAQAEQELAGIDAVMARRPALDLPSRRENVEKAISFASRTDDAERKLARVQQRAEQAEQRLEAMQLCVCGHPPHETSRCRWCECGVYAQAVGGTYNCPICGWNEPHTEHADALRERAVRLQNALRLLLRFHSSTDDPRWGEWAGRLFNDFDEDEVSLRETEEALRALETR